MGNKRKESEKYSEELLQAALVAIKDGSRIGAVAKQFGIPKTA